MAKSNSQLRREYENLLRYTSWPPPPKPLPIVMDRGIAVLGDTEADLIHDIWRVFGSGALV